MERVLLMVDAAEVRQITGNQDEGYNTPSFGSDTMSISSNFFFFFFFSPSASPAPPIASIRNFDNVSVSRPSWMAVRSSTAVAVEVNRWIAWTLSLERYSHKGTFSVEKDQTYALFASSGVSNSFHRSLLSILASLLILKTTKPMAVSARTSMVDGQNSQMGSDRWHGDSFCDLRRQGCHWVQVTDAKSEYRQTRGSDEICRG